MLITVVLYILFTMKRTQRIIPVLEQKSNSSLAFVQLVSTLHFENGNHLDMARKKMRYFLFFIRTHYGLHAHALTKEYIDTLAERSGVDKGRITNIHNLYETIEQSSGNNLDPGRLMELYQAIETFYKHCK